MTIQVEVKHVTGTQTIQVHKVHQGDDGTLHVEDGVRMNQGDTRSFTIWGNVRLAIEEVQEITGLTGSTAEA